MTGIDERPNRQDEDDICRRLIARVAQNLDRDAFAGLFDRLAPRLKSFLLRKGASPEQAEDIVQEAMTTVWRKAGFYDPSKGTVITWVFTIARNLRIDRIRRESSVYFEELGNYDDVSDDPSGHDILNRKQEGAMVREALSAIPEEQKQVLIMAYLEDMPQSEIADRLQLPIGTVKSRIRLAYGRLRKSLESLQ